jgi:hypothetical protein
VLLKFQFDIVVDDGHWLLFHHVESSFPQFVGKADAIRGLELAGAKPFVDIDGCADKAS